MKELGAIPFCITNIPQTMLSYACSNPVYGCTNNPHDSQRTPGGSSGGEACLIAQGGSILGLGSDVGGSLRIPAHFCGITALKPTQGRLCERGRGQVGVLLENSISIVLIFIMYETFINTTYAISLFYRVTQQEYRPMLDLCPNRSMESLWGWKLYCKIQTDCSP